MEDEVYMPPEEYTAGTFREALEISKDKREILINMDLLAKIPKEKRLKYLEYLTKQQNQREF